MEKIYVGIDVSKDQLDVYVRHLDIALAKPNTPTGIAQLVQRLRSLEPSLVIVEATGGYEHSVIKALNAADLAVSRVNPRQVRDFAKSTGKFAKTDALDAKLLAHFGEAIGPAPTILKNDEEHRIEELVLRRSQLIEMQTAELNRKHSATDRDLVKRIKRHLRWLKGEIRTISEEVRRLISAIAKLKKKDEILRSAPGVGPTTSAILVTRLPELGTLSRKQIAALVGIAPINHDSGKSTGARKIWGGRREVRAALYMSALSAIRRDTALKQLFIRLKQRGKPGKVAMVACMRKQLTTLNAMLRDGQPMRIPQIASAAG